MSSAGRVPLVHDPSEVAALPARRMPERVLPTRAQAALFALKVSAFQIRRAVADLRAPVPRLARGADDAPASVIAQSRTPLWSDIRPNERGMQRGKVENLRQAARRLDRIVLPAGAVFSFWREVGPPIASRGFVPGRMLQEGCLVASVGGGLCQLTNALYDAALQAGCEIVERHAHSRIVPGSLAQRDRDATVAWNYVDLRFSSTVPLLLRVTLDRETLTVTFKGTTAAAPQKPSQGHVRRRADDCASCGEVSCFRHGEGAASAAGINAFVLDAYWPEYDAWLAQRRTPDDIYALPIDGKRWGRANYAWETGPCATVAAPVRTLRRALASRHLAAQGAARQRQLMDDGDRMAAALSRALNENVTDVYVAQTFLPWLWRHGMLGGRRVHVLMSRLPLRVLEERLDDFARRFPDRDTLRDFRSPAQRIADEEAALADAYEIITPHTDIAALFGERAVLLSWRSPLVVSRGQDAVQKRIAFPGPVVARKGAFEVRDVARALDLEVVVGGAELEGRNFWTGVSTHAAPRDNWLAGVAAVVLPALIEERPRRLLAALAVGVPVIATPACGLVPQAGLTLVPFGDADALMRALIAVSKN